MVAEQTCFGESKPATMQIDKATKKYERWMATKTDVVAVDLDSKHSQMAADPFSFFRATFYRWMQLWPQLCGELGNAPALLAVGDLHIENFGTWRDQEGRLVWGVNDFDEADPLPYTADLVRLAASALLAGTGDRLAIGAKTACESILAGYIHALETGGAPFVMSGPHAWMRVLVEGGLHDPASYWQSMKEQRPPVDPPPATAIAAIERALPKRSLKYRIVTRTKGLGSLGRPRYIALATWQGGMIAREVKALVPSACCWAAQSSDAKIRYESILKGAVRCQDPFVQVRGNWLARRLAPDCTRIELSSLAKATDEERLLRMMGRETANIHLGTPRATKDVLDDLKRRPAGWLAEAAKTMVGAVMKDWDRWKETFSPPSAPRKKASIRRK